MYVYILYVYKLYQIVVLSIFQFMEDVAIISVGTVLRRAEGCPAFGMAQSYPSRRNFGRPQVRP